MEETFTSRPQGPHLYALRVFLNNPITTMAATVESEQPLDLAINPAHSLGSLPCGYYPLAETREESAEPGILVHGRVEHGDSLHLTMKNQSGRFLCNVLLTFSAGPTVD